MKIHDFGLWFKTYTDDGGRWSTNIPPLPHRHPSYERHDGWDEDYYFEIFYDGVELGFQWNDFDLEVYTGGQFIIKFKNNFKRNQDCYEIGRRLTLDDFEIIPNPAYGLVQGAETPGIMTMFLKNLRDAIVNRLRLVKRFVMRRLQ